MIDPQLLNARAFAEAVQAKDELHHKSERWCGLARVGIVFLAAAFLWGGIFLVWRFA